MVLSPLVSFPGVTNSKTIKNEKRVNKCIRDSKDMMGFIFTLHQTRVLERFQKGVCASGGGCRKKNGTSGSVIWLEQTGK